jgi:hypothetical protein
MSNLMQKNNIEKLFFQPTSHTEFHIVEISPEIAKKLLSITDSKVQRKFKRAHILSLSEDMKNGDFINNNGDTIRQDCQGNIIDGQHRLAACIEANYTLKTIFVKGLQTDTIKTIDIGQKTRTFTDVLEINHRKNYKYANQITSAVKFIYRFNHSVYADGTESSGKGRMNTNQFLKWIDKNPEIIDFIAETMLVVCNGDKLIPASIFCGLKWILDKYNKTESDKFFQMLSDGIGIDKTSSIYLLRKRILSCKFGKNTKQNNMTKSELIFTIVKSWNYYLDGKKTTLMLVAKNMPKIKSIKKG